MSKEEFQQFLEALKGLDTFQCIALTKKLSLLVVYFHYNLNFHNDNSTSITSWLGRYIKHRDEILSLLEVTLQRHFEWLNILLLQGYF